MEILRRLIGWVIVIAAVMYVIKHPHQTAGTIKGLAAGVGDFVTAMLS